GRSSSARSGGPAALSGARPASEDGTTSWKPTLPGFSATGSLPQRARAVADRAWFSGFPGLPHRVVVRLLRRGEPAGHRHFLLRIEVDPFRPLDVQVAEERLVPAGEREPGHRRRHADVDADHPGVETALELAGRPAAPREDGRAVAVLALPA